MSFYVLFGCLNNHYNEEIAENIGKSKLIHKKLYQLLNWYCYIHFYKKKYIMDVVGSIIPLKKVFKGILKQQEPVYCVDENQR